MFQEGVSKEEAVQSSAKGIAKAEASCDAACFSLSPSLHVKILVYT